MLLTAVNGVIFLVDKRLIRAHVGAVLTAANLKLSNLCNLTRCKIETSKKWLTNVLCARIIYRFMIPIVWKRLARFFVFCHVLDFR